MSLPIGRHQIAQISQESQQYDQYPVKGRPFGYPAYLVSQLKAPRIRFGGSVPYSVYGGYIPAPHQPQNQEASTSSGLINDTAQSNTMSRENTVDQQTQTQSQTVSPPVSVPAKPTQTSSANQVTQANSANQATQTNQQGHQANQHTFIENMEPEPKSN